MKLTRIDVPMEDGLLEKMKAICKETGVGFAYAFYLFVSQFVENRGFPFEAKVPKPDFEPFASEEEAAEFCDAMFQEAMEGDQIEIRLPPEVFESLVLRSKTEGKTIDELILKAIEADAERRSQTSD